jgi:hypothetical protein
VGKNEEIGMGMDCIFFLEKFNSDIEFMNAKLINDTQPLINKQRLTPKGPRGVFIQKRSKSAISSSRSPNNFIFTFLHFQP